MVPRAKQRTEQLRDHIVQMAVAMLAADGVRGFTRRVCRVERRASRTDALTVEYKLSLFAPARGPRLQTVTRITTPQIRPPRDAVTAPAGTPHPGRPDPAGGAARVSRRRPDARAGILAIARIR